MKKFIYVSSVDSQEIYVWQISEDKKINLIQVIKKEWAGHTILIHPNKKYLYLGIRNKKFSNETINPRFGVVSFQIDEKGVLHEYSIVSVPCSLTQLTIDLTGTILYGASYNHNCLTVQKIKPNGLVSLPKQIIYGLFGCHSVNIDFKNSKIWVPCLRSDKILFYEENEKKYLIPSYPYSLQLSEGSGPRNIVFNIKKNYGYVINELNATIQILKIKYLENSYEVKILQCVKTISEILGIQEDWASTIQITPNNKWLYCCNRRTNKISWFMIKENGRLIQFIKSKSTETQPRSFSIDEDGKYLVVAGQKSNWISLYEISQDNGDLLLVDRTFSGRNPSFVTFLNL